MPPPHIIALHFLKAGLLAAAIGACAADRALTQINRRTAVLVHTGLDAARSVRYRVTLPRR